MLNITESDLWDSFRSGNELAFTCIYSNYVNVLFNYGRRYCDNMELIKDCIQDMFVYIREKRDRLGQTNSIKLYLFRTFRRRLTVSLKKLENENYIDHFFDIAVQECLVQKGINDQHDGFMVQRLNRSLQNIRTKEKEAIHLYYYEKLSYEEIAKVMNYTHVSSARRLIYTALQSLKANMS
jgi:RNA polymerase sigma factor (sigma-70 family)